MCADNLLGQMLAADNSLQLLAKQTTQLHFMTHPKGRDIWCASGIRIKRIFHVCWLPRNPDPHEILAQLLSQLTCLQHLTIKIECNDHKLAALPQSLAGLARLQSLSLLVAHTHQTLPDSLYQLSAPQELSLLSCLTRLHTDHVSIGGVWYGCLHLQELKMSWAKLFPAFVLPDAPQHFSRLHTIALHCMQLQGDVLCFSHFPSLNRLSMTGFKPGALPLNSITTFGQQFWSFEQLWAAVACATCLTRLELSGPEECDPGSEKVQPQGINFNMLSQLTALQELSVFGVHLPQVHLPSTLHALQKLELLNAVTESFSVLGVLTSLTWVDLTTRTAVNMPVPGLPNLWYLASWRYSSDSSTSSDSSNFSTTSASSR